VKVINKEGPAGVTSEGHGRVERGHQVDVDAATGKRLLEQGWEKVSGGKAKTKRTRPANPRGRNTADALDKSSTPPPAATAADPANRDNGGDR
jgi:hypothetical protein